MTRTMTNARATGGQDKSAVAPAAAPPTAPRSARASGGGAGAKVVADGKAADEFKEVKRTNRRGGARVSRGASPGVKSNDVAGMRSTSGNKRNSVAPQAAIKTGPLDDAQQPAATTEAKMAMPVPAVSPMPAAPAQFGTGANAATAVVPGVINDAVRQVLMFNSAAARNGGAPPMSSGLGLNFGAGLNYGSLPLIHGNSSIVDARLGTQEHQDSLDPTTNVYVNGLPTYTTDDDLLRIGSCFGKVASHKAIINTETGLCKGYGFLMYETPDEAHNALTQLAVHGLQTSWARESFSSKLRRMADHGSSNVYLSNLPITMTNSALEQLFAPHVVVSLRILTDYEGVSRGVGFVRLRDRDIAQECIDRLHGKVLPGMTSPLQARFADSEAQKRLKQTSAAVAGARSPEAMLSATFNNMAMSPMISAAYPGSPSHGQLAQQPGSPYGNMAGFSPQLSTPSLSPSSVQSSVFGGSPNLSFGSPDGFALMNYLYAQQQQQAGMNPAPVVAGPGFSPYPGYYHSPAHSPEMQTGYWGQPQHPNPSAMDLSGQGKQQQHHQQQQRGGAVNMRPLVVPRYLAAKHDRAQQAAAVSTTTMDAPDADAEAPAVLAPLRVELGSQHSPVRMLRADGSEAKVRRASFDDQTKLAATEGQSGALGLFTEERSSINA